MCIARGGRERDNFVRFSIIAGGILSFYIDNFFGIFSINYSRMLNNNVCEHCRIAVALRAALHNYYYPPTYINIRSNVGRLEIMWYSCEKFSKFCTRNRGLYNQSLESLLSRPLRRSILHSKLEKIDIIYERNLSHILLYTALDIKFMVNRFSNSPSSAFFRSSKSAFSAVNVVG